MRTIARTDNSPPLVVRRANGCGPTGSTEKQRSDGNGQDHDLKAPTHRIASNTQPVPEHTPAPATPGTARECACNAGTFNGLCAGWQLPASETLRLERLDACAAPRLITDALHYA
jgi:hypothetical protein